jgi:hypothetical protein
MKIFPELTCSEKLALAKLVPTHTETYLSVYAEEGVFDVRNKIYKQCLVEDRPATRTEVRGRAFLTDNSVVVPKEMWQIPYPNRTETKTVLTYNLSEEMSCIVEMDPNATYFFTGATVEKIADWLDAHLK